DYTPKIFNITEAFWESRMELEATITEEMISPSSPTPEDLKKYELSMFDQIAPSMFIPVIFNFPPGDHTISSSSFHLKNSLAVVLTPYYPLAGRVSDDGKSIDCDGVVPVAVAEFKGKRLSDLMEEYLGSKKLRRFLLPCEAEFDTEVLPGSRVLNVQLNYFACGSLAVAAVFWHKAVDAA
ncbi:hypothetical protein M569_11848, partial [Genlisea aurea]